ncbi:hypothetical protein BS47DRAFT_1443627 [Hydnum rufescens UP504]|uniref:Uncharacterized protein n=1 Tax=Hydnum rufescens UP504 TaxID=1448309 RepID=A0A9P6DZH5_9AGAM|nr:hypothetical protein BS47DRAFT_1443627 [Hydnum rufescens UP504]
MSGYQPSGPSVTSQEVPGEGMRPLSTDTNANGKGSLSFMAAKVVSPALPLLCHGFTHGFWPFADTSSMNSSCPLDYDSSCSIQLSEDELDFLCNQ